MSCQLTTTYSTQDDVAMSISLLRKLYEDPEMLNDVFKASQVTQLEFEPRPV